SFHDGRWKWDSKANRCRPKRLLNAIKEDIHADITDMLEKANQAVSFHDGRWKWDSKANRCRPKRLLNAIKEDIHAD
ncbi:hypothetical protein AA109_15540, partial [Listeria monocytogenes]